MRSVSRGRGPPRCRWAYILGLVFVGPARGIFWGPKRADFLGRFCVREDFLMFVLVFLLNAGTSYGVATVEHPESYPGVSPPGTGSGSSSALHFIYPPHPGGNLVPCLPRSAQQ